MLEVGTHHYYRNLVATPKAVSLLGLSGIPAYEPNGALPEIIPIVRWHPWLIRSGDGKPPRVIRGPYYTISRNSFEPVAKRTVRLFIIEDRVVAINFAPYLKFDENIVYEADDVDGLVIYERFFLEIAEKNTEFL